MDKLWAPWRMEYIEKVDKEDGCFLCDALKSGEDRKNLVLYRGKDSFVVMNKYPYNSSHLMIVPNVHEADLLSLSDACRNEMLEITGKSMNVLRELFDAQGFNYGMNFGRAAGAGVEDHLHMHLVPRWNGDTNFMPVLAETKSIPEFLEQTYDKLIEKFKGL